METGRQTHNRASLERINYKLVFAVFITLLAGGASALAWLNFKASSPVYPPVPAYPQPTNGVTDAPGIFLTFPSKIQSVVVKEYSDSLYSSRLELDVTLPHSKPGCVRWWIGYFGTNMIRSGISGQTPLKFSVNPDGEQQAPIESCTFSGSPFPPEAAIGIDLSVSPFGKSGYMTSINLPTVAFGTTSGYLKHWIIQSSVYIPWAFAVSSGAPIASDSSLGWNGSGLGWNDSGPTSDEIDPQSLAFQVPASPVHAATIIDLSSQVSANRSLFVAGILAGLAGALIPWAGQLAIDSHKKSDSERNATPASTASEGATTATNASEDAPTGSTVTAESTAQGEVLHQITGTVISNIAAVSF
jgi:hypothetical protein